MGWIKKVADVLRKVLGFGSRTGLFDEKPTEVDLEGPREL